jgi:hypothetical protein
MQCLGCAYTKKSIQSVSIQILRILCFIWQHYEGTFLGDRERVCVSGLVEWLMW